MKLPAAAQLGDYCAWIMGMHEQSAAAKDDNAATIAAAAIIAACLTTIAHEAFGHGGACLASGGRIELLTSVYFECAPRAWPIALAGPLGDLAWAAVTGVAAVDAMAQMVDFWIRHCKTRLLGSFAT